ncbi:hypothetical protein BD626DRAFT_538822 [Schizophyllum amplum]|uniref:C2H2-type domain-containing protein n=1 Tax=Schizophyllum amplum TaxID=97359 RepID=A0A550C6J4_9AGAR|nr:hypothetical protein BD626DRAFT_538822 [Auriculariopsis ampla]
MAWDAGGTFRCSAAAEEDTALGSAHSRCPQLTSKVAPTRNKKRKVKDAELEEPTVCAPDEALITRLEDMPEFHSDDDPVNPWPCPWHPKEGPACSFRTTQKQGLKVHFFREHTDLRINCPTPQCDYSSPDPSCIARHRKRKHGWIPNSRRGPKHLAKAHLAPAPMDKTTGTAQSAEKTTTKAARATKRARTSEYISPASEVPIFLPATVPPVASYPVMHPSISCQWADSLASKTFITPAAPTPSMSSMMFSNPVAMASADGLFPLDAFSSSGPSLPWGSNTNAAYDAYCYGLPSAQTYMHNTAVSPVQWVMPMQSQMQWSADAQMQPYSLSPAGSWASDQSFQQQMGSSPFSNASSYALPDYSIDYSYDGYQTSYYPDNAPLYDNTLLFDNVAPVARQSSLSPLYLPDAQLMMGEPLSRSGSLSWIYPVLVHSRLKLI